MPHRMRQQCFNNPVVNIAAWQLQGWMLHLWMSMHYQGWWIPAYDLHFRHIDVSLDKANDLGDKDFLHKIRGSDNKCTDMVVPDYFQYHMVFVNSYLTRRVHSQKAYPSTHTSSCDAVMTQLISCLDESRFIDGAIFVVTVLKNELKKIPGNSWSGQWHQTDHSPEMKNIILWDITVNELQPVHTPGMADTGSLPWCGWWRPVNPKQYEYFLNLAHDICRAVGGFPTPKLIEIALHIPKENRSQATVPFSNRLGSSSTPTMSTYILQPRQSELMNRQLVVASSSHRTSMTIHTVCIWQPWFQRVHQGWKNTAW